uniref:Tf2-1-like SH3-like domain-containing protein n=1 Tax=Cajanus cajan TaxID=3821 RepID=A0A151T1Z9_CAJCA|nr:hypothetical protein KK1_023498 [Cajanus cajan]
MKQQKDKQRMDITFAVGEWVLLRLQPYRQRSLARSLSQKLAKRFYGPFRVSSRVGTVAYKLDLPSDSKIHPVFHVSLLRRFHGDPEAQSIPLPQMLDKFAEDGVTTKEEKDEQIEEGNEELSGFGRENRILENEKNIMGPDISLLNVKSALKEFVGSNSLPPPAPNEKPRVSPRVDESAIH